jgi:hypothetical protein
MADFDWEKDSAPEQPQRFDWDREAVPETAPTPTSSAGGAALRGFGQGLTANFGDELGAGLQAGLQRLANALPEGSLDWAGVDNRYQQDAGAVYREARAANREQLAADMEQHTGAALAGNIAGGLVSNAIVPGSRLAGGAGLARAGVQGAAAGLGESEADLTRGQVGGSAVDALKGAALGVAAQGIGEEVGRIAPRVAQWVQRKTGDFAALRALNAAGYGKAELKPIIKRGGIERAVEMGERLLDEPGVIRAGHNVESVMEGAEAARQRWGAEMGRILGEADATGAQFDMSSVGKRIIDEVIKPNLGDPAIRKEINAIGELMADYLKLARQQGGMTFSQANKLKSTLENGTINWGNHWNNYGPSHFLEKYQVSLAGIFADEIDNQLGARLGGDAFEAFKNAKAQYGTFKDAVGKAKNLNAAMQGNQAISLKDLGVGTVAGGGPVGFAATLASKVGRERGASALARGADAISQSDTLEAIASTNPDAFGRYAGAVSAALARGPEALRALDKVLRDTDPAWRQLREQQQESAARR